MPSTEETINIILGTSGEQEVKDKLVEVQQVASDVVQGIKDSYASAKSFVSDTTAQVIDTTEVLQTEVAIKFNLSAADLTQWFGDVGSTITRGGKELLDGFSENVSEPLMHIWGGTFLAGVGEVAESAFLTMRAYAQDFAENMVETMGSIGDIIGAGSTLLGLHLDDIVSSTRKTVIDLKDISMAVFHLVRMEIADIPVVGKAIEGAWLGVKTAALGTASALLSIPSILRTSLDVAGKLWTGLTNVFNTAVGVVRGIGEILRPIKDNVIATASWLTKVTGLQAAWSGLRGIANVSFKATGLTAIAATVTGLLSSTGSFSKIFTPIIGALQTMLAPMQQVLYEISTQIAPLLLEVVTPIVIGMAEGVKLLADAFTLAMAEGGGFKEVFGDLAAVAVQVGEVIFQVFGDFVITVFPEIMKVVAELTKEFGVLLEMIVPLVQDLITSLFPALKDIAAATMPILRALIPVVMELLQVGIGVFMPLIKAFIELVQGIIPPLLPLLGILAHGLLEIVEALSPILVGLAKVLSFIVGEIAGPTLVFAVEVVTDLIVGTVKLLGKAIEFTFGGIKSGVEEIVDFVSGAWTSIANFFRFDEVENNVTSAMNAIVYAITHPITTIKEVVNSIYEVILDILDWTPPLTKTSLGEVLNLSLPPTLLQAGGVVTGPVSAVVGEGRSPEVVLPLEKEVLERVVPSLVEVNVSPEDLRRSVKFPEVMKTEYGSMMAQTLEGILMVLRGIEKRQQRPEPDNMLPMPEMVFGLGGFS